MSKFGQTQRAIYGQIHVALTLQQHFTQIEDWNINDLLFYLCSLKVIEPSSYLRASEQKGNFFYCPWDKVTQDNFYNVLDFVHLHHEDILKHAVKNHLKNNKQQIKVAFFDCTNTYFETPYNDVAWQTIRFVRREKARLQEVLGILKDDRKDPSKMIA